MLNRKGINDPHLKHSKRYTWNHKEDLADSQRTHRAVSPHSATESSFFQGWNAGVLNIQTECKPTRGKDPEKEPASSRCPDCCLRGVLDMRSWLCSLLWWRMGGTCVSSPKFDQTRTSRSALNDTVQSSRTSQGPDSREHGSDGALWPATWPRTSQRGCQTMSVLSLSVLDTAFSATLLLH